MKVEEWKAFSPWFPPVANLEEHYVMLDEMQTTAQDSDHWDRMVDSLMDHIVQAAFQATAQELGDWDRMIDGLMGQATV